MPATILSAAFRRAARLFARFLGLTPAGRRFGAATGGTVAIVISIAIIPLVGLLGAAADYSAVQTQRTKLNAAADAAALTAVGAPARSLTADVAKERATATFTGSLKDDPLITLNSVSVDVTDSGTERLVKISYSATYKTSFTKVYGIASLDLASTITARGPLTPYIDFYLLLDNSPSMGLGATTADIDKLVANTSDKCAFACHQMDNPTSDYYSLAKKLGISMRIDVVRSATQSLTETATLAKIRENQFGMAIYTFGDKAEKQDLTEIQSLSYNLASVKSAAAAIDLMTIPYPNYRGDTQTNFDSMFKDIAKKIPKPGDGSTPSKPQKVLFFVSDGVNDANKNKCSRSLIYSSDPKTKESFARCMEPISAETCEDIKERGIKIAVLYTTYFPLPTNGFYNSYIKPFQPTIGQKMQACASEGLYFEVSPSDGIAEAMNALFKKTINQVSLTK